MGYTDTRNREFATHPCDLGHFKGTPSGLITIGLSFLLRPLADQVGFVVSILLMQDFDDVASDSTNGDLKWKTKKRGNWSRPIRQTPHNDISAVDEKAMHY